MSNPKKNIRYVRTFRKWHESIRFFNQVFGRKPTLRNYFIGLLETALHYSQRLISLVVLKVFE